MRTLGAPGNKGEKIKSRLQEKMEQAEACSPSNEKLAGSAAS
jgi:hypothetical protein